MGLSVVIPTHQRAHFLPAVISAVLADQAASEVIVVADGCTDGSQDIVRRIGSRDQRVRLLELDPNQGEHAARLAGVKAAEWDAVLCVDDDVLLARGTVAGHARHHERRTADVIAGYMPVRIESAHDIVIARYAERYERHVGGWEVNPDAVLSALWAGNVSFSRLGYLRAAAEIRQKLRHHADQELGLRLQAAGQTAVFDRNLAASHLFRRTLDGTLRDAWFSGVGYATLLPTFPDAFPDPAEEFRPEAGRIRGHVVRWSTGRVLSRPLKTCTRMALAISQLTGWEWPARQLLGLLSRGNYVAGFGTVAELNPPFGPRPAACSGGETSGGP